MSNIQVTNGPFTSKARSESAIAINPSDPQKIVAASKRFRNLLTYDFTIATAYSVDGGQTWGDSADPALEAGWTGITDPAVTWDDAGNVFLVGLAFNNPPAEDYIGIAVYKSTDGGASWGAPMLIHASPDDDKQWVAADNSPTSPFHGRVYAAWDSKAGLLFARTLDHGATWIGFGTSPAGSVVATDSEFPEINVGDDGTIYIVARTLTVTDITMFVSNDGGESFHAVTSPATGIMSLDNSLLRPHGEPVFFPEGNFRVFTLPTACAGPGRMVAAAWADNQLGVSRIYYALSHDGGVSWVTGPRGQPLLTGFLPANQQHFHPQIVVDSRGKIGCAFYEFGPKPETPKIDVFFAQMTEQGTFSRELVTNEPWDPAVGAPWAHGDPNVTFIGEYFGLDASRLGFYPLWTDTRTLTQELWMEVLYRPFQFVPVYPTAPGPGIGSFDLLSARDRAFAFDYDGSGKTDHLVLYRPGTGAIAILKNTAGSFSPVYNQGDPGGGIGGYDLLSDHDRGFAFDYDGSGKLDHLVFYRPGTGVIYILKNSGGSFSTIYPPTGAPDQGIGRFDLLEDRDRGFAFDYDGSGKLDHLVFYRPGTGAIAIVKNSGGTFDSVYFQGDPGGGIGGYDLLSSDDRGFAFDYDGSGKLDHLVLYRPGGGAIGILKNSGGSFLPVYFAAGGGIGAYDLMSTADRMVAFDFDSGGKQDYLVPYRPGTGTVFILRRGGGFPAIFRETTGIGGYDLLSTADRMLTFDYDSSGKRDHLVLYRPGTGTIWILKKT